MSRLASIDAISLTGLHYPLEVFAPETDFTDAPAVYLYLQIDPARGQARVLYVGEAQMLNRQIAQDRRHGGVWDRACALGCNAVAALPLGLPGERSRIARDFMASWAPPCNPGAGGIGLVPPALTVTMAAAV